MYPLKGLPIPFAQGQEASLGIDSSYRTDKPHSILRHPNTDSKDLLEYVRTVMSTEAPKGRMSFSNLNKGVKICGILGQF